MRKPSAFGCGVCGAFGEGVELGAVYRDGDLWRTYEVEHRGGDVHRFASTNLPLDHKRYQVKEVE